MSKVQLFVYDLSNGLASQFGSALTGRHIEGIWHTAIVVHGQEIYFGQGIAFSAPGRTHHGQPKKIIDLGTTTITKADVLAHVQSMRSQWTANSYHLLENNCNHFSNTLVKYLNGGTIPREILYQSQELMATEFGRGMRPMIDNMFRGAGGNGVEADQAVEAIVDRAVPTLVTSPPHPHDSLSLPTITKLSKSLAAVTFATLPPLASLTKKLNSSFADISMTESSASIPLARSTLIDTVLPFLYALPTAAPMKNGNVKPPAELPPKLITGWRDATRVAMEFLPAGELFTVLDLWRIGLALDPTRLSLPFSEQIDESPSLLAESLQLASQLSSTSTDSPNSFPRSLLLTFIKLFSNALASTTLANHILNTDLAGGTTTRRELTELMVRSLLDEDRVVRMAGAGLVWSAVAYEFRVTQFAHQNSVETEGGKGRLRDEEWEIEIASAVLSALAVEENVDVVHRFTATLSLLLFKSPHFAGIVGLLEVLDAEGILGTKEGLAKKEKREDVVKLAEEVRMLIRAGN